ncbi:MAG: hypothetical protein MJ231_01925 [bacterium]|nr:hypothetical protein [bacterium]
MINNVSQMYNTNFKYPYKTEKCSKKAYSSVPCVNFSIKPLQTPYNVQFTGLSLAREYNKTSHYLAALTLEAKRFKYGADGNNLSSKNILPTIERLFKLNKVYLPFTMADKTKVKWKNYIPDDIRDYSINKINDARIDRFNTWKTFLENPTDYKTTSEYNSLKEEIKNDDCLKFIIWNAINFDIKNNNRHIPVPFDINALSKTVTWLNSIERENRKLQVVSIKEFLDMYTHKLKDELLMSRPELLVSKKYIPEADSCWVRIPAIRKDLQNSSNNIAALECLSNENWCTRSSLDKAEAALQDGDFCLYLKRDDNQVWQTVLGMTSYRGKIDQIQGPNNDNLIPIRELDNIRNFLKENELGYVSGITDEGPKAMQQIMIAEKLKEIEPQTNMSLFTAINKKNNYVILKMLFGDVDFKGETPMMLFNNSKPMLAIKTYKSSILLNKTKGITVPIAFFGINEDSLLSNVVEINGDFILKGTRPEYNSQITTFPKNLKRVTGKILCTQEQYNNFKEDMLKVVKSPQQIIVYNN